MKFFYNPILAAFSSETSQQAEIICKDTCGDSHSPAPPLAYPRPEPSHGGHMPAGFGQSQSAPPGGSEEAAACPQANKYAGCGFPVHGFFCWGQDGRCIQQSTRLSTIFLFVCGIPSPALYLLSFTTIYLNTNLLTIASDYYIMLLIRHDIR